MARGRPIRMNNYERQFMHVIEQRAKCDYVLFTAARNEARYIGKTITSVIGQSKQPVCWVIVDDHSTDDTGSIVDAYAKKHPFIRLIRREDDGQKGFASKVAAMRLAIETLKSCSYQFLGNLDGDVSFGADYFEKLLERFSASSTLGIAGGQIYEVARARMFPQSISNNSVAGAAQFFRKECFEAVGGYRFAERGGEDAVVEILARAKGWQVQTLKSLHVLHHGYQKNSTIGLLKRRWNMGAVFYELGYHPLFQFARLLARGFDRPPVVGSLVELGGYLWCETTKPRRIMSVDGIRFLRREQMSRLYGRVPRR